ncbi:SDR family NAD(P)-dependent oxidoreductase [Thalassospira sp.]|uniref:SDR family NAD(P)-dependent oxidoreductase n=1 Tax=Thalassospira sp. TaxID=1912094 RepID=UPI000C66F434|nr:SDR family NAD(P)-dependent oxidoreductase [Thalassospira sp.]MBC07684.1 LPS biosynthesis protein WbpP [Thalassospira sp.]|tara:strand:+ start:2686 stop:3687 length:1002 start_codon:yes stop_codon:yes gene_type:complete
MTHNTQAQERWFVTGAAGFIGSNLCAFLIERGAKVVGYDNFFSGKHENVERLLNTYGEDFTFIEGDILDEASLHSAISGCERVAHLAAQVSVMRSIDLSEETHDINTTGFLRVIEAAAKQNASSLVYASSCAVYGENDALPLSEDERPCPMSPYAASKLANEAYASGMSVKAPELNVVGLRFFNIFGAWQDAANGYAAVIPKWIDLLIEGKRPVMFGDGSATRDFCHVENVCNAIWKAVLAGEAANGKVFNVASGVPTRLDRLYELIVEALVNAKLGSNYPEPEKQDWRVGEILHSYGSPKQAKEMMDFAVEVSLQEGLQRMLSTQYCQNTNN